MGITRISNNVYSVGVINPSLRVFDIVMKANYGTSYNSYLINDTKKVLIDTVHIDFWDEYIYNIGCLVDLQEIDYVVINHTELDHTGSLSKLLELNPNITVVCTMAAKKYLSAIMNRDFKCLTVKNSDKIDIGSTFLEFIVAPFLHWPDSMMTWYPEDKTLFSCDFLGCHFCEPTMLDGNIKYYKEYLAEFEHYYNCILKPFKQYVLAGIQKLEHLSFDFVCPSHGPVISQHIDERINDYKEWSVEQTKDVKTAVIIYCSSYGCTKMLAQAAYDAIKEKSDVKPILFDIVTEDIKKVINKVEEADALIVGSPTINKDAPKIVWDVLCSIDLMNNRCKPAGAFGSYGWSGEAFDMIKTRLSQMRYNFIDEVYKVNFMPTEEDMEHMKQYAIEIVSNIK